MVYDGKYPKVPLEAGAPPNLLMLPTPLVASQYFCRKVRTIHH
jgi:hypothetical protein